VPEQAVVKHICPGPVQALEQKRPGINKLLLNCVEQTLAEAAQTAEEKQTRSDSKLLYGLHYAQRRKIQI
jgi:hypothetical protein